jgi:signal transduction histidine kinase
MIPLSTLSMAVIGAVLAIWLGGAVWAISTGVKARRAGVSAARQADRLANLLQSAPAIPVLIRPDGRLEAPARLGDWLGRSSAPGFASELTGEGGGLVRDDGTALAKDIAAAQRAAKNFSRVVKSSGGKRMFVVRGGPAGPELANNGGVILWIFDVTESHSRIAELEGQASLYSEALEALSGLIEAAPMPMWHRTSDLRLSLVNSAYVAAVEGKNAADVIHGGIELVETVEGLTPAQAAKRVLETGQPYDRFVPATLKGERRMMEVVEVPLGKAGVAGYAIDQNALERSRAENQRILASQRDMLDRLSAGVAQFGADRTLRFWNQPFVALFAIDPEHLNGGPEFERVLDRMREAGRIPEHRDFPAWRAERRDWFLSPEAREENWLLADGTHLRLFAQPLPDGGLLMVFENRTEQVRLSSARDTLLRVRTATFDSLFEGVSVFASDGRLQLWNNRFRKIWDVTEEALATHPRIDDFMEQLASRLAKPQQAGLVRELVRSATVERKQRNGRVVFADERTFDFAAIPLPDGNALFTMLDVTDSRRVEGVLREQNEALEQADKVKTAFLANMSYDLRTPLTSIAGFAEMMKGGYAGDLPDTAKDYVDAIMQSTSKLAQMIDTVLDLTQGEAGALPLDLTPVDLAMLAKQAVERHGVAAQKRTIDLVMEVLPSAGRVMGDPRRISQILDHLIDNAIRYMPERAGGRILVHGDGQVQSARLIVSDNGAGMDAKAQAKAFDRFSRMAQGERSEAMGLGLPLARQLAEAHGGKLTLISEPGQGTVLTLELPRGERPKGGDTARG